MTLYCRDKPFLFVGVEVDVFLEVVCFLVDFAMLQGKAYKYKCKLFNIFSSIKALE